MLYFYQPRYIAQSNGISLQYELVHSLKSMGIHASILCYAEKNPLQPLPEKFLNDVIYLSEQIIEVKDDDIVFYSDSISNNPLKAKQVVRYLLNKPIFLTQEQINYGNTDYLLSYSFYIYDNLPQLFFLKDERIEFDSIRSTMKKKGTVVYLGKVYGKHLKNEISLFKKIKNSIPKPVSIVTRGFPKTHNEMLTNLANASLLISLDGFTNTIYEATLLGTPALILDDPLSIKDKKFNLHKYGQFYDYQNYSKAKAEVDMAYPEYVEYCNTQNGLAKIAIEQITNHFKIIIENPSYAKQVSDRNSKQSQIDFLEWNTRKKITCYNIDTLYQIPKVFKPYVKSLLPKKQIFIHQIKSILSFFCRFLKMLLRKLGLFKITKKAYLWVIHLNHK